MVDYTSLGFGASISVSIISLIIVVPLSALILFLVGKMFHEEISYVKALLTALIVGATSFVIGLIGPLSKNTSLTLIMTGVGFIVTIALMLTLPKFMFALEWKKGLLIGLSWWGIYLAVAFIVALIAAAIVLMLGVGAIGGLAQPA